jgi:hypothetical protein
MIISRQNIILNNMKILLFSLFFLFTLTFLAEAQNFQVELYQATMKPIADDIQTTNPLRKSMNKFIGYPYYQKLGSATCSMENSNSEWLIPSKTLFLELKRPDPLKPGIYLELFQEKRSIFKGVFNPKRKHPLIITGPHYGEGRLVMVLSTIPHLPHADHEDANSEAVHSKKNE